MIENAREDIAMLNPELVVQADIYPGVQVSADAELLAQVIQNLVGNAVKFSGGESPITLSLRQTDELVELEISNRGETIPEEGHEKIFERFYRADQAHSRKIDGSGLGLSLAREIARAHGGSLTLADFKEGVTTFRLTLPQVTTECHCHMVAAVLGTACGTRWLHDYLMRISRLLRNRN